MNWLYSLYHDIHLVVIDNLDINRIPILPPETDSPLIIDPNAILTAPLSRELLQAIRRWAPQISKCFRRIQNQESSQSHALNSVESLGVSALKDLLGLSATEPLDHV